VGSRGWLVGLGIGLIVGAGAMYLVLRPPWGDGAIDAPVDAAVAIAPKDAGAAKPRPKKRPKAGWNSGNRRIQPGPDFVETEDTDERSGPTRIQLTATDRALEWRGDTTSISRTIDASAPGNARPLEDGEINATVSGQTAGVRACVEQGAAGTDLRATITVKVVVEGNGKVSRSQLQAPRYLFDKGLLGCARRALGQMRFPASGAPTLVTFPIHLG
jgi:hypothetical protein